MTKEQFISFLLPILLALITAAGTLALYGLKILTAKAKAKLDSITDDNDRKYTQDLLKQAEDFISTAVVETNQILVDNLKKANEDGKLTTEEIAQSFGATYEKVKELMGEEFQDQLNMAVPNTEAWIKSKIEYYVNLNK